MALQVWPKKLPQAPLFADYNEKFVSLSASVTTGNRSTLIRRVSTRAQDKMSVAFCFTREQVAIFETFFYDTLAGGSNRFLFTHPRKQEQIEVSFDPAAEQGFTIVPLGTMRHYKAAFTLIIWS